MPDGGPRPTFDQLPQTNILRSDLAADDIEIFAKQGEGRGLEERKIGVDRADIGENQLQHLEPGLRSRFVARFLDKTIQFGITHRRSVEGTESAQRITAVDDGVEER